VTRQRDISCRLLAVLLVVFVILATWYSLTIPLGEAPDEVPHFGLIRHLVQHGHLASPGDGHEAFQPPLYYLAGAILTFWIPDHTPHAVWANADYDITDPLAPRNLLLHPATEAWPFRGWALAWHLVRLLSVLLGATTVWAVFHLGRQVFPEQPAISLGMAALTAFTPQFLFMSAVINNDNAAAAVSALVLWQIAALLRRNSLKPLHLAVLGLLLGLGLLSKASLLALVPVIGLAILCVWWNNRARGTRHLLLAWLITFGVTALMAGWVYVRNLLVFGDPLAWSYILVTNPVREVELTIEVLAWLFQGLFHSFWLGWIGVTFDEWIYWGIGALCLLGLAGFVAWLVLRWRRIEMCVRWTVLLLGLHAGLTLLSLVQWTATVRGTDQARLIYPILPTVMLVMVSGLLVWLPTRRRPWAAGLLAGAWLVLAIMTPIYYIKPVHAPPPLLDSLPAETTPLDIRFGDSIRLVGYRLENPQVHTGEKLLLDLYWQAESRPEGNFWALIELVGQDGSLLLYKDGSPSAGRDTTDRWKPGPIVTSHHRMTVPEYGAPGTYRLTIRLHLAGERMWLPAISPDGRLPGDTLTLAVLELR